MRIFLWMVSVPEVQHHSRNGTRVPYCKTQNQISAPCTVLLLSGERVLWGLSSPSRGNRKMKMAVMSDEFYNLSWYYKNPAFYGLERRGLAVKVSMTSCSID